MTDLMINNKTIRTGIIGCGMVVQKNYLSALPAIPFIKVTDVYDLNKYSADYVAEIMMAQTSSLAEMKKNVDTVIIATPPQTHYELAKEFILAGKHVVCEKPFVGKKDQAIELTKLAQRHNVNLFVAHFRRCFPTVKLARSIVKSGILGKIKSFSLTEGGRFTWSAKSGYTSTDPYGGVLFDTGSHTLDMALYISGLDSKKVEFFLTKIVRDKQEPSHEFQADIRFVSSNSRGKGHIFLSRYRTLSNIIIVEGEYGSVELSVGLSNKILLRGKNGTTIVHTEESITDLMECFALQFHEMFHGQKDAFTSDKFVNLTSLLETISK
jgi:predicted dehydrogenase